MSVHSFQKKKRRDYNRMKFKTMGNNDEFLRRVKKTLYYGKLPLTERLSLPVTELASELYSEITAGRRLDRLRLEEAAEIGNNACVSPCSLVLAMLYLERLKTCNPTYMDKVAPSELFLISIMVASKFLNDDGEEDEVLNSEWASSAGLHPKDVNRLEKEFLAAINWQVFIQEESFWSRLRKLERDVALKEGKRRGWFSYTELENLLDSIEPFTLAQALLTVSFVCLASYTAGILTIVGSTMLVSQIPMYHLTLSVPICSYPSNLHENNSVVDHAEDIVIATKSVPGQNISHTRIENGNSKCHQNWGSTLTYWPNVNMTGNNDSYNEIGFPLSTNNYQIRDSCFSSVSCYIQSITQHLSYFPTEIVASY